MYAAVAQFAVVQIGFFAHLPSFLGHSSHGLSFPFAFVHLLQDYFSHIRVFVEEVVHLALYEVADELVYGDASVGLCGKRTEFYLGLAFKQGLLDVDTDGSHHTVADIAIVIVLSAVFLDYFCDVFLECGLVRATQCGVLSVYEGIVFLSVLVAMCEGYFDVFTFQMYYLI